MDHHRPVRPLPRRRPPDRPRARRARRGRRVARRTLRRRPTSSCAHPHAPPRARDPRALHAPPARARRRRGARRARCAGAPDDAVRQAPGQPRARATTRTTSTSSPKPDTLIGAWIALTAQTRRTAACGSRRARRTSPSIPTPTDSKGHGGDTQLADIVEVGGADDPDEARNDLAAVAAQVPRPRGARGARARRRVFFGGHVLHRSHANRSATRSRRAFVAHYCNARSAVPWDDTPLAPGELANGRHILARGATHLPYAEPRFSATRAAA